MNANRWVLQVCSEVSRLIGCECAPRLYVPETDAGQANASQQTITRRKDGSPRDRHDLPVSELCIQYASALQTQVCLPSGPSSYDFAIPLASDDLLPWYATGMIAASTEREANRLLQAANEAAVNAVALERHKLGAASASLYVSRIMKEQNWLRDLATLTRIENAQLGLEKVTSTILEPLQRVLQAETVGLYVGEAAHHDSRFPESRVISSKQWMIQDIAMVLRAIELPLAGQIAHYENVGVEVARGRVDSILVGCIETSSSSNCYVVAINHTQADQAFPQRKVSFGQHELGLFHEAIYHLSTFYSNLQLIVDSDQLVLDTLRAMSQAIEVRDPYTSGHSERVARIAGELAYRMGLSADECQKISLAGVLHDIGKIGVPDQILLKPGRLTPEEQSIIQRHPEIGYRILKSLAKLRFALPGVLHHHERWDGKGYPHQLAGENIPLMARILAVADAFDAMSTSRPYRVAMSLAKTKAIMQEGAGNYWDPAIVKLLLDWLAEQGDSPIHRESSEPFVTSPGLILKPQSENPLPTLSQLTANTDSFSFGASTNLAMATPM